MVNAVARAGIPGAIVAHQGGWDEMLLIVGPIAIVAGLLWLARRRVMKARRDKPADMPEDSHPSV